jgi:hypothetical protein
MQSKPDIEYFVVGQRVQAHPCTDIWMRGDRFGTVARIGRKYVSVRMDVSKRTLKFHPLNLMEVADE